MDDAAKLLFRTAAMALREGRQVEAEAAYRSWMAVAPADPRPRYGLATILLSRGAYKEGWGLYEARTEVLETGIRKPAIPFPEWRGEEVGSLLVCNEQGIGDQIMFARYIPPLVARGISVSVICPPSLSALFAGLGCEVLPLGPGMQVKRHDRWCLIGSLPYLAGQAAPSPYLGPPYAAATHGVGLMTAGNPAHLNDAARSLPDDLASKLAGLSNGRSLAPEATGAANFADTAAIIAGLRLVISVDTAVAHLAGAMGKECLLLLPKRPDWRWGQEGDATPWYSSMRIFRQATEGDWRPVLQQVEAALAEL